jgi:hypothetical protein
MSAPQHEPIVRHDQRVDTLRDRGVRRQHDQLLAPGD